MEHVVVRREAQGYWLDPTAYTTLLPSIRDQLPSDARSFAEAPGHDDFYSTQCVKDLRFESLSIGRDGSAAVSFAPNQWKHDVGLTLAYKRVDYVTLEQQTEHTESPKGRFGAFSSMSCCPPSPASCTRSYSRIAFSASSPRT
jgi:hypothetical protein